MVVIVVFKWYSTPLCQLIWVPPRLPDVLQPSGVVACSSTETQVLGSSKNHWPYFFLMISLNIPKLLARKLEANVVA